jgi:hypothetical protein
VTNAWRAAEIRQFEHVAVNPSTGLLRVTAKPVGKKLKGRRRPTLVADNGVVVRRFAAIPSPADGGGVLHSAYSVPAELVTPETVFSLELGGGEVISLPAPVAGAARLAAPDPTLDDSPGDGGDDATEERRSDMTAKLVELSAALAEAVHAGARREADRVAADAQAELARAEASALEARVGELEDSIRELSRERDELRDRAAEHEAGAAEARERLSLAEAANEKTAAAISELDVWRGELERRLAETTTELAAARARVQEGERQLRRVMGELTKAQAELQSRGHDERPADEQARERMRTLEAEREDLAWRVNEMARLLKPMRQPADAGRGPTEQLAPASSASAEADVRLEEIARQAVAEASTQAQRELSEAAAETRTIR